MLINKYYLTVMISVVLLSCNNNADKTTQVSSANLSCAPPSAITQTTTYSIQLFLVDSVSKIKTYGYTILADGKVFIHQPSIPSVSGNSSFKTESEAQKVANLMVYKLRNNIMPPSVTPNELDSLGVLNN